MEVRPKIHAARLVVPWLVAAASLFIAAAIVPNVDIKTFVGALVVALIVAVLNAILPPVTLPWSKCDERLTVSLRDTRTGMFFELEAAHDRELDVFYHLFSYASARTVRHADARLAAGIGR